MKQKRLKPQTDEDYKGVGNIVNYLKKCNPQYKDKLEEGLDVTIDVIFNKDYRKVKKLFGKPCIDCIMDYYIKREQYEECIPIRDISKRRKTPV